MNLRGGCVGRASQPEGEGVCMGDLALMEAARDALGFQLTGGQETALDNVLRDLEGPAPMMCLLQVHFLCAMLPYGGFIRALPYASMQTALA